MGKIQSKGLEESPIRLVSGEEIRYWYNESNYCEDTIRKSKGTLGKSCMRYADCQNYLNIYVENPSVCKLLILVHENKLRARALYWITDKGNYLDRIYYTDSSESNTLEDWVADNDKNSIIYSTSTKLTVQLESNTGNYNDYPYMDSMVYYYIIDKKLYNYEPKVGVKRELLYCQDTEGGYDRQNMVYCEYTDDSLPEEETVYSQYHSSNLPKNSAVWSKYFGDWIYDRESYYSDYLDDIIPNDERVSVYLDEDQSESDYFPSGHKDIAIDGENDEYYLKSLMIEVRPGLYFLKSNLIELFIINKKESIDRYNTIFNIVDDEKDPVCSYALKEFYNFDVDADRNRYELKSDYYSGVYMNVYYKKMYNELYDNDDANEAIEELEQANDYLKNRNVFYKYNNHLIKRGGFDRMIESFKKNLDDDRNSIGSYNTVFDIAFRNATYSLGKHVQSDLLKSTVRNIIENNLFGIIKEKGEFTGNKQWNKGSQLDKISTIFEESFPEYKTPDDIRYYFDITLSTISQCINDMRSFASGEESLDIQTIEYFMHYPNKMPII